MLLQNDEFRRHFGSIHSLPNASRGEGGHLDLLRYCLIYMESYSTERYNRGEGVFKTVNLALCNE